MDGTGKQKSRRLGSVKAASNVCEGFVWDFFTSPMSDKEGNVGSLPIFSEREGLLRESYSDWILI